MIGRRPRAGAPGVITRAWRRVRDLVLRGLRRFTNRMSLAIRVAVLTTAAVAVTLTLVSATIFVTVRSEFESSLDESMLSRSEAGVTADLGTLFAGGVDPAALALTDIKVIVLRTGRGVLMGTPAISNFPVQFIGLPERQVALGQKSESVRTASLQGTPYRVVAVRSGPGEALVIAQSMESIEAALDRLQIILLLTSAAGVAMAGLAGWAVAANGLRPVRRLTAATERVARTVDLTPITVSGTDELARLSTSFNAMLAALDAAQTRERQLIADAGHELRTPLTSLRTNIELMGQATAKGQRSLSESEHAEIMGDVRAQVEELTNLVGDLVELARDEPVRRDPEPLDLADVLDLAVSRVRLRTSEVDVDVTAESWMVVGEPQLLERGITNLLDNAVKWSPPGHTVQVTLSGGVISVSDEGPGIDPSDLPHIFDRFYRSQEARTLPGSGLGLSIVKRAAERHGGRADVESVVGEGSTFTLSVPAASTEPL